MLNINIKSIIKNERNEYECIIKLETKYKSYEKAFILNKTFCEDNNIKIDDNIIIKRVDNYLENKMKTNIIDLFLENNKTYPWHAIKDNYNF